MKEKIGKKDTLTDKDVIEAQMQVHKSVADWKNFLSQNKDPEHPLVNYANSIIEISSDEDKFVQKKGIPEITRYISSAFDTAQAFPSKTPLSESAKILTEKYPNLPRLSLIIEYLPISFRNIMSEASALIMNYQYNPHCYDNWEIFLKSLKK